MAEVTLMGKVCNTNADLPAAGVSAPDFSLTDTTLTQKGLSDFGNKRKLLSIVPSLDTQVCATSSEAFDRAATQSPDSIFLVISADLPFAQQRFCKEKGLTHITPLSMMRSRNFAKDYGVLLQDGPLAGITARAVLVLDEQNRVLYSQLVPEIGEEPDYEAALKALSS